MDIKDIAKAAKEASLELLGASEELKNSALKKVKENPKHTIKAKR